MNNGEYGFFIRKKENPVNLNKPIKFDIESIDSTDTLEKPTTNNKGNNFKDSINDRLKNIHENNKIKVIINTNV